MVAVAQEGFAIRYVPKELKYDKDIEGFAIEYVSDKLKIVKQIALQAVIRDGNSIDSLSKDLKMIEKLL